MKLYVCQECDIKECIIFYPHENAPYRCVDRNEMDNWAEWKPIEPSDMLMVVAESEDA